ncbi:MAG: hypothetical protein F7C33_00400 [Desulfurococcales archaeon]|nr:hypothetical protein [Desulfurococcales archaeon]
MKYIKIALLMATISAIVAAPASYAYLAYTPQWSERLNVTIGSTTYPLDVLYSVTFDSNYAYFVGTFTGSGYSGDATTNSSLVIVSYKGDIINNYAYYYGAGNLTSVDALYAWGNVYITGYISGSAGVYGIIYSVNASNGSVKGYYVDTDTSYTVIRGVCRDGLGHVFAVGFQYSPNGSPKINATVFEFDENLNLVARNEFYASGFNLTGWDCVIGPNGALYVSATIYYYNSGYDYPVYFLLMKLNQSLGLIDYTYYPLYNSQGYVTLSSNHWIPLATDNNLVYAAYTWTDDKPSPSSPTTRASVIAVNTSLSVVWNYTLSTDAYEFLDALSVGSDGSLIAGGGTNNNYTTPLSTDYYHGLALIFDSAHSLQRAVLFGGSSGEIVLATGIDALGGTYLASLSYSDNVSFYDVTKEVLLARSSPGGSIGLAVVGQGDYTKLPVKTLEKIHVYTSEQGHSVSPSMVKPIIRLSKKRAIVPETTASGLSSGLAVKLADTLTPPPEPVPESVLVPVSVVVTLALILLVMWKKGFLSI